MRFFSTSFFISIVFIIYSGLVFSDTKCATIYKHINQSQVATRLLSLNSTLEKLKPTSASKNKGIKIYMAAIELGAVNGLRTSNGAPLNIKAGGVAVVLTDVAKEYPKFLSKQNNGQLTIIGILMDNISKTNMKFLQTIKVPVDGKNWDIGVYEYINPQGARYLFLENPSFQRFNARPDKGESVYTMRGLEADNGTPDNSEEKQKIWAAINQSIAKIFELEGGDVYIPQDYHVSPASFYIRKHTNMQPVSTKPLIHNEGYVGSFSAGGASKEKVKKIWGLSDSEQNEYFMQGENLVMLAPSVRLAEQNELQTAYSVSDGTASTINKQPDSLAIDFFGRVEGLTNGLSDDNRPFNINGLKPASEEVLQSEGITDTEVINSFKTVGFQFGSAKATPAETIKAKEKAKLAIQKNYKMTISKDKPLFITFARLVHQKGIEFAVKNIEHILNKGGQVVISGSIGDDIGAKERQMLVELKAKLERENNPNAKNFVFLEGLLKEHAKALLLAGSDFFMIPSRYEPCGLTDVEALYMGSIPIAHNVGGLGKGKNSILYGPTNPDDQGWELGQAVNRAFDLYKDKENFNKRQLSAMQENFSWEQNFEKLMTESRLEVYYQMLRETEAMVAKNQMTIDQAKNYLSKKIFTENKQDSKAFIEALKLLPANKQTELLAWLVKKL